MEISLLPFFKEYMSFFDFGVNAEMAFVLYKTLRIVQDENHFRNIYFWGKIPGVKKEYYFAYGYRRDAIRGRVFYYSLDASHWVLLPKASPSTYYMTTLATTKVFGDPSLQIVILDEEPKEEPKSELPVNEPHESVTQQTDAGEPIAEVAPATDVAKTAYQDDVPPDTVSEMTTNIEIEKDEEKLTMKEEDRLGALIRLINREALIVPRGAVFKRPDGLVVPNKAFRGVSYEDSLDPKNYFHFRVPTKRYDVNLSKHCEPNYAVDFLDGIDDDIPKGYSWALHVVADGEIVVVRSLHWPGMSMFHHLNTDKYGCLYMGNGKKNMDIPFMIM